MLVRDITELRKLVTCLLDEAIATVAEEEFNRLRSAANNDFQVARKVTEAVRSLRNLQQGEEPAYNEWDALFYLTWYQPRQINLALYILQELYEDARRRLGSDFPLHIIDVGCGALAVQFAAAILAAENQRAGNDLTVSGIDPSEPMKRIGEALWSKFRLFLGDHSDLSDLSRTCDHMANNCQLFDSHSSYFCSEGGRPWGPPWIERWITAVHACYESNWFEIQRALQELRDRYSPNAILVTSHRSRQEVVRFVAGEESPQQRLSPKQLPLKEELPKTTEWRTDLLSKLPAYQINSVSSLLSNPVEWAPRKQKSTLCKILRGD